MRDRPHPGRHVADRVFSLSRRANSEVESPPPPILCRNTFPCLCGRSWRISPPSNLPLPARVISPLLSRRARLTLPREARPSPPLLFPLVAIRGLPPISPPNLSHAPPVQPPYQVPGAFRPGWTFLKRSPLPFYFPSRLGRPPFLPERGLLERSPSSLSLWSLLKRCFPLFFLLPDALCGCSPRSLFHSFLLWEPLSDSKVSSP